MAINIPPDSSGRSTTAAKPSTTGGVPAGAGSESAPAKTDASSNGGKSSRTEARPPQTETRPTSAENTASRSDTPGTRGAASTSGEATSADTRVNTRANQRISDRTAPPKETNVIRAIVAEVQARQAAAANTRAHYTAIVQLNPSNAQLLSPGSNAAAPPQTQIDSSLAQKILAGQPVSIRVETGAPLVKGQVLDVELTQGTLKLLKVSTPAPQLAAQALIRQELSAQGSYVHLLGKLIGLLQTLRLETAATSPRNAGAALQSSQQTAISAANPNSTQSAVIQKQLEGIVTRFVDSLAKQGEVVRPEGLKQAIANSGIFYEGRIASPAKTATAEKNLGGPSTTSNSAASQTISGTENSPAGNKRIELIQQIREQIRSLHNALNERPGKTAPANFNPVLSSPLTRDLKYNLLQLEAQLKQLQAQTQTLPPAGKTPEQPGAARNQTNPANPLPGSAGNTNITKTSFADGVANPLDKALTEAGRNSGEKMDRAAVAAADQAAHAAREASRASPVYQRPAVNPSATTALYQEDSSDSSSKPQIPGLEWVHPPLPGRIHVQPQGIHPNLAANESLADALISVLIKHTREATARMNLHQLTSLTDRARPEAGPQQTMLSFELPILQGLQLSLFQFRIYDETAEQQQDRQERPLERKWVVHMGFDLEGLGPMYCQITLIGVSASVTFWAEDQHTVAASQSQVNGLKHNLNQLGVNVKEIQCIKGAPPSDQSGIKQTLIDIQT